MTSTRPLLVFLFVCGFLCVSGRGAAQPLAESTFDSSVEGWTTGENGTAAEHVSTGGRPGGYVRARSQNTGDVWYWEAPSSFTGDHSAAYNGALRFELTQSTTNTALDTTDVVLEGPNATLSATVTAPPTSSWTPYRLPLRPAAGWTLEDGQTPTVSEMKDVLASLQAVRIRGNHWSDGGATGLDNVRIQAAQTVERWVNPSQTYLQIDQGDDEARNAIALNLANLGLSPGDEIRVVQPGEFDFNPFEENTTKTEMVAVFSGSDDLGGARQSDRVVDAIDAGEDFSTAGLSVDIPEDFLVDGSVVRIPQGATHLFLSSYDTEYGDNEDADGDYRLRILQPSPPVGLTVEAPDNTVDLAWEPSDFGTVEEYNVYRDTAPIDSSGGTGTLPSASLIRESTYVDESVEVGETYHYRVTAVDSSGNESSFSLEIRATPGPQPSPPSNVRVEATGDSSAVVRWQGVADAARYRLYRDTAPIDAAEGPSARSALDSTDVGVTDYVDTGLIPGTTYHYRITSVDADANESEYSAEGRARPPLSVVATPDTAVVPQADTVTIDVLANDVAGRAAIDTVLTRIDEDSDHGQATVNDDAGTIDYVHDGTNNFDDAFAYVVEDRDGATDTTRVVLSIRAVTLAAERDTIRLGRGQVGALGPSTEIAFTSTGDTAATGLSLALSNPADYSVIEDTGEDVLQPGGARTVRVGFKPDEVGSGQETSVTLETRTGIESTVVLIGTGVNAQVQTSAEGGVARQGEPVDVSMTPQGPFEPTSRRLYARPGGGTFQELDDPSQIPASLVTAKGIDYYAVLSDGDVRVVLPGGTEAAARRDPSHLPVQFNDLTAPLSLASEAYRMVSVPARTPIKQALRTSYGGYNPSTWRVLRWAPSEGEYREFPDVDSLQAGMGFWLVTAGGSAFSLESGTSVDASSSKQVVLERGWNQVGTPFNFSVPWDTVQAASGLSGAEVDGPVGYRASEGYRPERAVLKPWESYFVFNATGSRDTLVVPPVGAGSQKRNRAEAGPAALTDSWLWGATQSTPTQADDESRIDARQEGTRPYTLRVTARSKNESSQRVWLGLRSDAKVGRDGLDFAQAPPVGHSVRLSVRETVQGRSVPHAGSFKPMGPEGRAWTLVLERPAEQNGPARPVRLGLQSEGALPDGQMRYLLDLDGEQRLTSGETLSLAPGEQRRLKVIVGTRRFAQKKSDGITLESYENALRGNAPNPFSGETSLTYVLEEETTVTLEVYNVLGQRVRTLVQDRRDAGVHHVRWNGQNRYGEPVGSGVYFYRITAGDFQKTRKMVLVR